MVETCLKYWCEWTQVSKTNLYEHIFFVTNIGWQQIKKVNYVYCNFSFGSCTRFILQHFETKM